MSSPSARGPGLLVSFASLVTAQALGAGLGLVFWVVVARLVVPEDLGAAAAAISTQTLLGSIASLGVGTLLISELPRVPTSVQRRLLHRGLAAVLVASGLAGVVLALSAGLLGRSLQEALAAPGGSPVFVVGVAAAAAALVVDQAGLGLNRATVQVGRSLLASGLRFPLAAGLLAWGFRGSAAVQLCWVAPLALSVVVSLLRLRSRPSGRAGADRRPDPPLDPNDPPIDPQSWRADLGRYAAPALRNHGLSLSLAAGSQLVPLVAALVLSTVDNASFAIAWLLATFVFLPPYLLATALFAHGANASVEEFRETMRTTVPAALTLSLGLCVGAWVLGRPVLSIFGAHYASTSWVLLALLVPAGLWMVLKDHLVAFWRSQRRYRLGVSLTLVALALELAGATVGGLLDGGRGLCAGWLAAMVVEVAIYWPWLRQTFGGLAWRSPLGLLLRRPPAVRGR